VVEDQYVELFNRLGRGDYRHWFESGYEMYSDELHIICNMVNQLAREVGSDTICLPYFQLSGQLEKYLTHIAAMNTDAWVDTVYRSTHRKQVS
jgi:hypothetical protein